MPRVKVPRCYKLATAKLWGLPSSSHAPAKAIAVRKFTAGHGAIVQQKAGAGSAQLQDYRNRKPGAVSGHSIRALAAERGSSPFAAAPYLKAMQRGMHVSAAAPAQAARRAVPAPSFAARPVWDARAATAEHESPQAAREAAVRRRLVRSPLYAYAQLEARGRAAGKAASTSSSAARGGTIARRERDGLAWYAALGGASGKSAPSGGVRKAQLASRPRAPAKQLRQKG